MTVCLFLLNTNDTTLTFSSRTGGEEGKEEDRDEEMIDAVGEEGEEEDGDSEEDDQVRETDEAQSEQGKQPVFHHEIYHRLVNLMSRQGAYSMFLTGLLLQRMR